MSKTPLKSKTIINLICSVAVLITSTVISFWLSPYIVEHIGVEANGFVSLANNFVTYAGLIVGALNSMAARYITIAYHNDDKKKASLYYNSVFWGNLIIVAILVVPAILLIIFFENLFDVPADILLDVKILFAFVFAGFFAGTAAPNWNVGCYVTNRLDREYIPEAITAVIRSALVIGMLTIFTPHVWYVGLASFIITLAMLVVNCINTHQLTPDLRICRENGRFVCSFRAIWELVGSGLWNSVSSLGNVLLTGLDLIVCNAFFGATAMGVLSVAKTLPNLLQNLSSALTRSFSPELTIDYAKGNKDNLKRNINRSMKLTGSILTIFVGGFVAFGQSFFALWVPSQDAKLLAILSALSFLGYFFTAGTQILYNVFSTTNTVRQNATAMIICGIVSIIVTFILLKTTDLGLYAVAAVSSICALVKNFVFTFPMTAKYLGFKKTTFFPMALRTFISTACIVGAGFLIQWLLPASSWWMLMADACIVGVFGLALNCVVILSKDERRFLVAKILRKGE
jgi:O-antigen/teichoic acid export membrane protein